MFVSTLYDAWIYLSVVISTLCDSEAKTLAVIPATKNPCNQDCCAATDPANHDAAVSMIKKQGGVFGAVSTSTALIAAMESAALNVPAVDV